MTRKPSLLVVFLTVFIDLVGFGIVLPLLPIYSEQYGAGDLMIGVIIASFSAMQFLFAPAWGRLSDRIGRRPVLLISNSGSVVSYGLFGIAGLLQGSGGLWLLLVSRIFAGICGANLSVANAYIADISPPEKRSKNMGLIGMAFGLGFIFGPALGSFSADLSDLPIQLHSHLHHPG
jgi:MFS family permease